MSTLDPAGRSAEVIAQMWWVMLAGATVIFLGVMGAALFALVRRRGGRRLSEKAMLVGGGLVFPIVTLSALSAYALVQGQQLTARKEADVYRVEAVARQWSWTFIHPDGTRSQGVMRVPVGEPFEVAVTSEDVIHSFWVPRLGGKMDAIPGIVNVIRLTADAPGEYVGHCAEYCGIGHTPMRLVVVAAPGTSAARGGS